MKMKGALKPPDCLISNKNPNLFYASIISSIIIVDDKSTAVLSLLSSNFGNISLLIIDLQIVYIESPKTYDIYFFVIKAGVINIMNIIIRNSKSSNIMNLQNVNGTISNCIFYNISIQTSGSLFYFPVATLLYPCQIIFNNITIDKGFWIYIGSLATEKGFLINSAINNIQITVTNLKFLSTNLCARCYLIFVINNNNLLKLVNGTFWNSTNTSLNF